MTKLRQWLRDLPRRKPHIDVLTAVLTVPVLLTVLVANILSLRNKEESKENTPTPNLEKIIVQTPATTSKDTTLINPTSGPSCKKEVGPISIKSPQENEVIKDNPVCFVIKYDDPDYCSVVWSYRINGGPWSEYNANSVCLYDIPQGDAQFELRVQSTTSQDQETLKRNFKYEGKNVEPTPQPTSSIQNE